LEPAGYEENKRIAKVRKAGAASSSKGKGSNATSKDAVNPTDAKNYTASTTPSLSSDQDHHDDAHLWYVAPPKPVDSGSRVSWFWNDIRVYFTIANVMYLLGALIVAGAMTFFMTKGTFEDVVVLSDGIVSSV
jgi:hypothetical protein